MLHYIIQYKNIIRLEKKHSSIQGWALKSACFLTIKRKEQQQLANTSPLIYRQRRKYNMYNNEVGKGYIIHKFFLFSFFASWVLLLKQQISLILPCFIERYTAY